MDKVDLQIYVASLIHAITQNTDTGTGIDAMREDFGLSKDKFTDQQIIDAVHEEIELKVEEVALDYNEPKLTMDELQDCMIKASTRLVLENMVAEGLVNVTMDPERGENVYSLSEKGKEVTKKLL